MLASRDWDPSLQMREAICSYLGLASDSEQAQAMAACYLDSAKRLLELINHGYGHIKIYVSDGWLENAAIEKTDIPMLQFRKPARAGVKNKASR